MCVGQTYVDAQANGLLDLGVQKGDTVAVWMKNGAERVCMRYINDPNWPANATVLFRMLLTWLWQRRA